MAKHTEKEGNILRRNWEAIEAGDCNTIEDILKKHLKLLQRPYSDDGCQYTILDESLKYAGQRGQLELVKLFVQYGGDINAREDDKDAEGMIRCLFHDGDKNIEIVRWLLEHGAVINQVRRGRRTSSSLIYAAMRGAIEGVKLLLQHGAEINGYANVPMTALDYALGFGHQHVADYLRAHGGLAGWQAGRCAANRHRNRPGLPPRCSNTFRPSWVRLNPFRSKK